MTAPFWLQCMMTSFRESVETLKEAGLPSSEILEIMSDSVDSQLSGSISIAKTNLNNSSNKSGLALLQQDNNSNTKILTVPKKKSGGFSSEKYVRIQKATRQASLGMHWESMKILFDSSFYRTYSLLSLWARTNSVFLLIWINILI